jgi:LysM repeat protein
MAQNNLKPGDSSDDVNPGQIFQIGDGGATIIRNPDGSLDYSLNEINSVDIRDITDVVEHRINTIVGSRLHMVRFMNGGLLTYAYNNAGQLIELTSSGLSAEMSTNNDIEYYIDR